MKQSVLSAVQTIKEVLSSLRGNISELQSEKKTLEERKEFLLYQPIPSSDLKNIIFSYIDQCKNKFIAEGDWKAELSRFLYPSRANDYHPKKNLPLNYAEARQILDHANEPETQYLLGAYPRLFVPNVDTFHATNFSAYFFFGDLIKEQIEKYFDTLNITHQSKDTKNIGSSIEEREIELKQIEERVIEINTELEALSTQVNSIVESSSI